MTIDKNTLHMEMTAWRRDLHAHPEFGFEEKRTSAFVATKLREFGLDEVIEGVGGTGVVGTLRRGSGNRSIALRADMDALKITEQGDRTYRSQNSGVMHACGHDGHTAMLLGAAKTLAEEDGFDGTVRFIFQPAEEWGKGALACSTTASCSDFRSRKSTACTICPVWRSAVSRPAPALSCRRKTISRSSSKASAARGTSPLGQRGPRRRLRPRHQSADDRVATPQPRRHQRRLCHRTHHRRYAQRFARPCPRPGRRPQLPA